MERELPDGLYELLVTRGIEETLARLAGDGVEVGRDRVDDEEAPDVLAHHVAGLVARALRAAPAGQRGALGAALCNAALEVIRGRAPRTALDEGDDVHPAVESLLSIRRPRAALPGPRALPARPRIPLSQNALLTNAAGDPRLARELAAELDSADRVSLICAFVRWQGFRLLAADIQRFLDRGGELRVITTTYLGATEPRALERLAELGARIKVSYDTKMTRLHAKAWLFERGTGFSTAYIGSSNLSAAALLDGLEWNVRLAEDVSRNLLAKFLGTFDGYWEDPDFEDFDAAQFRERSAHAAPGAVPVFTQIDVRPYPFQQRILEALEAEREIHGCWRNLVVSATGTGKTVVAALDYRRLRERFRDASLLFVAHRKEILDQSLGIFRAVLRDGAFGESLVAGRRPDEWKHVFASIQSLASLDPTLIPPERFDVVIVDEFHHAAAKTYTRLLDHLRPKVLVGLTATPERADDADIVSSRFGGRFAVEIRLWDALAQHLLCPFHYFGVSDQVDLSRLSWRRWGYDLGELSNVYTGNDARVALVLEALQDRVPDVGRMRALGFCVSVEHARYMAKRFGECGIPSRALWAETPAPERERAVRDLRERAINVLFVVDLFNEGVDLPEVDTVLFLRPTESVTVFLQQLGRGLRLSEGKTCLTVLDFIGEQHRGFRFLARFRGILGGSRSDVLRQIESGFPSLPAGCHLELDRVARDVVLANIRSALPGSWRRKIEELVRLGDVSLSRYLEETGQDLQDLYKGPGRTWSALRRQAGLAAPPPGPREEALSGLFARMLHFDDVQRIDFLCDILGRDAPPALEDLSEDDRRRLLMFHFCARARERWPSLEASLADLWAHGALRAEALEVLEILRGRVRHLTPALQTGGRVPLHLHARYRLAEVLAAFGEGTTERPSSFREGAFWAKRHRCDVFFVTLKKSEREYSPTTMYRDYAISPTLFHWESQSTTTERSPTGQRFIHHAERGSRVFLFARHEKRADGGTAPYVCLGQAAYVRHKSERPLEIVWRLESEMPAEFFEEARVAAG